MRLPSWLVTALVLAFPAVAPAQTGRTVKQEALQRKDLLGTWKAMEAVSYDQNSNPRLLAIPFWLALWDDGLFWLAGGTNSHGGGRWRLNGDTLWIGNDWRYGNNAVGRRGGVLQADTVDTLTMMPAFPRNDSLFWTHTPEERRRLAGKQGGYGYWLLTAYKVAVRDGRLLLLRLDGLSNNRMHPASAIMEYQTKEPAPW